MQASLYSCLGARFDQVCFVVQDLDAAVEHWTKTNGITAWSKAIDLAAHQTEKTYFGQPGDFQFSCAYGFAGETLIELARHDGGSSVYKDWLDAGCQGPHHIGFRQADAQEHARADAHYRSLGLTKAMSGYFQSPSGNYRWAYYDTRPQLGCFTELYYIDGDALVRFEQLKRGMNVSLTG